MENKLFKSQDNKILKDVINRYNKNILKLKEKLINSESDLKILKMNLDNTQNCLNILEKLEKEGETGFNRIILNIIKLKEVKK